MTAEEEFLRHAIRAKIQGTNGATFNAVWTGLTPQERTDLILLVLRKPEEAGKKIRQLIISYAETLAAAEVAAFFARANVTPAENRAIFNN
jgi:hypothetical protein